MIPTLYHVSAPILHPAGWWTCAYARTGPRAVGGAASRPTADAARAATMASVREQMLREAGLPTSL